MKFTKPIINVVLFILALLIFNENFSGLYLNFIAVIAIFALIAINKESHEKV